MQESTALFCSTRQPAAPEEHRACLEVSPSHKTQYLAISLQRSPTAPLVLLCLAFCAKILACSKTIFHSFGSLSGSCGSASLCWLARFLVLVLSGAIMSSFLQIPHERIIAHYAITPSGWAVVTPSGKTLAQSFYALRERFEFYCSINGAGGWVVLVPRPSSFSQSSAIQPSLF